jgi:ElaB/YqjD/DUF883 family membrane-anchored ribosome-binding protein
MIDTWRMDLATLLHDSANGYMAATMAKRVSSDVVRQLPYPAIGAAAVLGVLAGVMISRRRRNDRPGRNDRRP